MDVRRFANFACNKRTACANDFSQVKTFETFLLTTQGAQHNQGRHARRTRRPASPKPPAGFLIHLCCCYLLHALCFSAFVSMLTSSERLLVLSLVPLENELFSLSFSEAVRGCASIGLIQLVWEKSRTKRNRRAKVLPPEPSWGSLSCLFSVD